MLLADYAEKQVVDNQERRHNQRRDHESCYGACLGAGVPGVGSPVTPRSDHDKQNGDEQVRAGNHDDVCGIAVAVVRTARKITLARKATTARTPATMSPS